MERKARTAPEPLDVHVPVDELPLEALPAEEILDAESVDDLWSVVDMQTEDQPLAGASEVMSYFTATPSQGEEEKLPWDELPMDAVMEEDEEPAQAYLADEDDEVFLAEEAPEEAVEAEEAIEAEEFVDADEVLEAEEAEPALADVSDFMQMPSFAPIGAEAEAEPSAIPFAIPSAPPAPFPAAPAAEAAFEPDDLHRLVEAKIREVISRMSKESAEKVVWEVMPDVAEKVVWEVVPAVVERIVWDVVPGLAEQIILKEIEKLKAGA